MLPLPTRSHPRYSVHNIVSYRYEDQSVLTLTLDLGLGGMKIKTNAPLPRGKWLKFRLVLGASLVWPKGRIVYSRFMHGEQMVSGVQFIDLSERDRVSLKNYLKTLEENGYGLPLCAGGALVRAQKSSLGDHSFPRMKRREKK